MNQQIHVLVIVDVMEPLIDAAKAGATIGEMNDIMRDVFGTWVSPSGV